MSITGMSSRIGYTRRHWLHFRPCPLSRGFTGALQRGQTRIFRSSGLTAMTFRILALTVAAVYDRWQSQTAGGHRPPLQLCYTAAANVHMLKRLSIVSLVLIFLITTSSHATTVQRLNLEDLVKKANRIVVGRISDSRTFWSDNGKLILTSYTIEVGETIKGQASRTVELTTVGGRVGDLVLHV